MALKVSELTASTGLASTDVVLTVNGAVSRKATIDQVISGSSYRLPDISGAFKAISASFDVISASYRPVSSSYNTLSASYIAVSASYNTISGSYIAVSASYNTISASYIAVSSSYNVISASYRPVSASYNTLSASYTEQFPRIIGTVVLSVSGANVGDIRLTGALYSSGAVYRRVPSRTISSHGPILGTDQVLFISCTANLQLTATNPAFFPEPLLIKKIVDNAFTIQIVQFGSERIEGTAATYTLTGSDSTLRPAWTLMSDGTDYWVA